MTKPIKETLIQILFVDLKNKPFKNLYHEVRKSGEQYALSAGNSDGQGLGVWIKQPVGTHLDIVVRHPISKKMIPAHQYIIVPDKKGKIRIQAPFYIEEKVKLQKHESSPGDYRRKTHVVKEGETLTSIAKQHGTTVQALQLINNNKIEDPNVINVGQKIKIPPKNSAYRIGTSSQSSVPISHSNHTQNTSQSSAHQDSTLSESHGSQVTNISNQNHTNNNNHGQSTHPSSSRASEEHNSPSFLTQASELIGDGVDAAKKGLNNLDEATQPVRKNISEALSPLTNALSPITTNSGIATPASSKRTQTVSSTQSNSQPKPTQQVKPAQTHSTQTTGQTSTPRIDVTKQGNCTCGRDLTLSELNDIISKLRAVDKLKDTSLFNYKDCTLPKNERNAESLLKYLNQTFKKYEINTCIRRIHFLAQIYLESASFTTTTEMSSGNQYNPGNREDAFSNGNTQMGDGPKYRGRGLMQLTWKNNYQHYQDYSNLSVVSNYQLVSDSLQISCDSAGWYWFQGKMFSSYPTWKGPKKRPSYLVNAKINFPTRKLTVKNKQIIAIDMNLVADSDQVDLVSYLVNGVGNGREARQKYAKELKKIFNYPSACKGTGLEKPQPAPVGVSAEVAPWMKVALREAKQWKGVKEGSITDNYHSLIGYKGESLSTAWCASFANYCLKDSGFSWVKNYSSQFPTTYPDKFIKIDKPIYGAIVVYRHTNKKYGTGHVSFIYGKLDNGDYAVLGGNQGDSITVNTHKHVYVDNLKCKVVGFFVPKEYLAMAQQLIATGKEFDGVHKLSELKSAIGDTTTVTLRTQ
mgnify:CR=1 FL=1